MPLDRPLGEEVAQELKPVIHPDKDRISKPSSGVLVRELNDGRNLVSILPLSRPYSVLLEPHPLMDRDLVHADKPVALPLVGTPVQVDVHPMVRRDREIHLPRFDIVEFPVILRRHKIRRMCILKPAVGGERRDTVVRGYVPE